MEEEKNREELSVDGGSQVAQEDSQSASLTDAETGAVEENHETSNASLDSAISETNTISKENTAQGNSLQQSALTEASPDNGETLLENETESADLDALKAEEKKEDAKGDIAQEETAQQDAAQAMEQNQPQQQIAQQQEEAQDATLQEPSEDTEGAKADALGDAEDADETKSAPDEFSEIKEGMDWYVVNAYSSYELKARLSLIERIKANKMEDKFGAILVPQEDVIEIVRGQKK
ncbi:MAG: hypothetical protein D6808_02145, partial [Candidatus Dadabacteria bacterium]